jgi:hypothetical protein
VRYVGPLNSESTRLFLESFPYYIYTSCTCIEHARCTRFVSLEKYTNEGNAACLFTLFDEHFHCNYEERIQSLYSYNHGKLKQTENQQALKVIL